MKSKNEVGFTIIETMLFLGITGLLILGILAGTSSSINIQRYRDSVASLQATLQEQFSYVSNISNERDGNWSCSDSTITTGDTARGQSDCVILGRFITTSNDSHTLLIKNVVGYIPQGSISDQNDIAILQQYNIKISPISSDIYDMEWGSSLKKAKPNDSQAVTFSMLILRSPSSGVTRTFIDPNSVIEDGNINTLVSKNALTQSAKLCVDSNGLFIGTKSAVVVTSNSTNASGIETLGGASGC